MKTLRRKLDLIECLSTEKKKFLELKSKHLRTMAGAEISIDAIKQKTLQVSVKNINGKRTSKYELFDYTYRLFSEVLPEDIRIVIKL